MECFNNFINTEIKITINQSNSSGELWDGLIYEYSALVSKELLYAAYQQAVAIPYNFLYIDLLAKNTNNMFFSGFTKKFKMVEEDNT